jgi:hypothetical protein
MYVGFAHLVTKMVHSIMTQTSPHLARLTVTDKGLFMRKESVIETRICTSMGGICIGIRLLCHWVFRLHAGRYVTHSNISIFIYIHIRDDVR